MKKLLFLILTLLSAVLCFAPVFAEEYRYIDAEEAGGEPVPVYKKYASDGSEYYGGRTGYFKLSEYMEDLVPYDPETEDDYTVRESSYYITADPSGNYVYITDSEGNRLLEDKFKCVYNIFDAGSLKVRYYGTNDFSGFAALDSDLEAEVPMGNYYYLSLDTDRYYVSHSKTRRYIGINRNNEGILQVSYYTTYGDFKTAAGTSPLFIYNDEYNQDCSLYTIDDVKAANEAGLLPITLAHKDFMAAATKGDLVSLAVDAVMKRENTDIFTYIRKNSIAVDYDKYLDAVSPDVLVAEALDLVKPSEGKYFNPDEKLTRQEAAYTINRLCEIFEIPITPYSKTYEDDGEIDGDFKEAVYNISGTPVLNSYIMAPYVLENAFKPDKEYPLEQAIIALWRITNYENVISDPSVGIHNKMTIGGGLYVFQNSDGRWGVWRKSDEKVIVEPLYMPAVSMYRLPQNFVMYPTYEAYASGGAFILSDKNNAYNSYTRDNTYYVFNTDGELLKTIHYGTDEINKDLNKDDSSRIYYVFYASGSNLVIAEKNTETEFETKLIKRLMSEIAVTGFSGIVPRENGEFTAVEKSSGKSCVLNPDGSLKEYTEE